MGLLRVLLALSVFMAHSDSVGFMSSLIGFGGANAVEIFFLISGFYIAMILEKSYSSNLGFYKNRALRLYPIYFLICALILVRSLFIPSYRTELFSFPAKALTVGTFANLTFFGSDWIMFLQWNDNNLNFGNFNDSELPLWHMLLVPPSWSLGIEVTFYLLAPLICRASTRTIITLSAAFLVIRAVAFLVGFNVDPWTYRFFPFELPMFLLGILLYRFKKQSNQIQKMPITATYTLLIFLFILFPFVAQKFDIGRAPQLFVLLIVSAIIILFGSENPKDRKFGDLSYPIYMSHVFVISSVDSVLEIVLGNTLMFEKIKSPLFITPINLFFTVLISLLILRLVKPIEKLRDRIRN